MKMKFIAMLLFAFWSTTACMARKLALVIGAGNYLPSSGLPKSTAAGDAIKIAQTLTDAGWAVTLLNDDAKAGFQPSADNILRILGLQKEPDKGGLGFSDSAQRFCGEQTLSENDIILFYWCGHGVTSGDGYDCIIPSDAVQMKEHINDAPGLIPVPWIIRALSNTGAGSILLFLDTPRYPDHVRLKNITPNFTPDKRRPDQYKISAPGKGRLSGRQSMFLMKSTQDGGYAHEPSVLGMGVFTHFFIQTITEKDTQVLADGSQDGKITIDEFASFIQQSTYRWIKDMQNNHGDQTPQFQWIGRPDPGFVMVKYSREGLDNLDDGMTEALTPVIYQLNNEDCSDFKGDFIVEEVPFFLQNISNGFESAPPLKRFATTSKARKFAYKKIKFYPNLYEMDNGAACLLIYFSDESYKFSKQEALDFIKHFQRHFPSLFWDIVSDTAQAGKLSFGWEGFASASVEDRNPRNGGEDAVDHAFVIMYQEGRIGIIFH